MNPSPHCIDLREDIDLGKESYGLQELNKSEYEIMKVDSNRQLNNFLESHGKTEKNGCVYYEFTRRKENISKDKRVILKSEVHDVTTFYD